MIIMKREFGDGIEKINYENGIGSIVIYGN